MVTFFGSAGRSGRSFVFRTSAPMYSGVVPQHPPATRSPIRTISAITSAKSPADTSNTVRPSTIFGSPALGFASTGTEAVFRYSVTMGSMVFGPREQLTPMMSAPIPSSMATMAAGEAPVISLPSSP